MRKNLGKLNPNGQVYILNQTILNIMSEVKIVNPREPEWMKPYIKRLSRKRNNIFERLKTNGYRSEGYC